MEPADGVALRIHDRGKRIVDAAVERVVNEGIGQVLSDMIGPGQLVLNARLDSRTAGDGNHLQASDAIARSMSEELA